VFAGPGLIRPMSRKTPRPAPAAPFTVEIEPVGDLDDAKRAWTAVYDLLYLGRVRTPDEIDEYDEP